MNYGFKTTTHGDALIAACMALDAPLKITRAAVGSGLAGGSLSNTHALVNYIADADIGERRHEGNQLFLSVQYRNDDHPEIEDFVLSEFIVYAQDPETGADTDLLYATLGDNRQPIPAFQNGFPASVWTYPIILTVSSDLQVNVTASPGLVTFIDLQDALADKQDQITGTKGQMVGFDENGEPIAEDMPDTADGKYLKLSGGVLMGDVRIGSAWSEGKKLILDNKIGYPVPPGGVLYDETDASERIAELSLKQGSVHYHTGGPGLSVNTKTLVGVFLEKKPLIVMEGLHVNDRTIDGVGYPVEDHQAASKGYVDAALSSKAALSVQQTVEKTGVTGRDITVAAADLQAYIDALPRLRTENLGIIVSAGHVPQTLTLKDFYGPGLICISGPGPGSGVLDDGLVITNCSNYIRIIGFDVRGNRVQMAANVNLSRQVSLENLTADGNNFTNMNGITDGGSNGAYNGIYSESGRIYVSNFQCSHFRRAVYAAGCTINLSECGGSGNAVGITVQGGIVLLGGPTPELMGGAANNRWGGMIVNKNGEPI